MRRERAPPAPPQRPNWGPWTWEKTLEAEAGVWGDSCGQRLPGRAWMGQRTAQQAAEELPWRGSGLSGSLGWVVIGCHGKQVPQPSGVP